MKGKVNMIKLMRGSTKSWRNAKTPLASGQPGYDKDKHKIKVGDGSTPWAELPYASGLSAEEILSSEKDARLNYDSNDKYGTALITYGTEIPNKNTVGKLYLQQYDAEPETDYVVSSGVDGIWTYQKWHSGIARCYGTFQLKTTVQSAFDGIELFHDSNKMQSLAYPFDFKEIPTEVAALQSPGWIAWLASKTKNTKQGSGIYTIISPEEQATNAVYNISLQVEGFWR